MKIWLCLFFVLFLNFTQEMRIHSLHATASHIVGLEVSEFAIVSDSNRPTCIRFVYYQIYPMMCTMLLRS